MHAKEKVLDLKRYIGTRVDRYTSKYRKNQKWSFEALETKIRLFQRKTVRKFRNELNVRK